MAKLLRPGYGIVAFLKVVDVLSEDDRSALRHRNDGDDDVNIPNLVRKDRRGQL